ncbi:hypothetical protein BESB_080590 [Besnoitia besnoiti]|uniref:PH domain-containing protein n=1 Tax=Besnoitia besnoiti TaxID=94643 RepID=A0A2A9MDU3_BESBE|nr:hypothetical protein BESB_080590 [Besnoitia besnoiti]PFH33843.1 hypothetical protein BESB_080590 [Besnoitia besnoiti]
MRFHFSQFQALLLSSSPGTWPPSLFACDDVGGSEGASAPGAASKSAAALSPAKVCVSSTDAGRRLAAKEAQRRGFLTQFVPVLEKKAVRFSVVKANFLFLFPPTELPEHLWLQQQQARLNGLPQGQAATPSSPLGLWLEDGRHIREGHTSDDELLYDIEVILLEDVQVAPVRKRLTHLSSPGALGLAGAALVGFLPADSAFGERFPDEDDVQYEDDLAHGQQQGAGEGPSGKSETGERGQEAKFEYGISLRFAECNEEYFLFAKDRASRQAWLDAVRKASNLRGQLEALVQEASEARFAASRYWARCRALRFEAQKWSSQVQCNAERSHRKLRACDAKEHDKLCERVVMLEELVDSLEGQLVLAEESKTESGLNREVAILQDALLVEAEKTSRLTQILCDVSAALPCDIGEKIRQLVQRLAGDSSPPAPACAPSPSAPAVAAKQKAGPPPPQAKKTEKQTASPPPPQFLKTALHSRSLSARVPHTKLREEEGAEGLARGTRSACLPQGERSKGHARESESKDTTNRPSQDAADSQLQSPALRPHHSPRAFLPVSSACSLRRPVGETVPCRYTEGRSTAASSRGRRRGDTREGDELAFSDGGATRLPCSSLHLCLPDDVVQLPDVCISSASPARFFSQATLGASPTTSSTVGSPPVEAAGKDAVADEPGLAVHVKGGASSDSVAQSPDTTQQAPRAHNNTKSPQARLAEGCAEGQLAAGLASVIQRNDVHLQSPVKLTSSCALPPSKSSTALPPALSKKVAFVGAGPPPASLVPVPSSKGRGGESPRAATPSTSASFCAPSLLRKSPAAVNRDTPAPSGTQPPVGVEAGREEERQKRAPAAPASSMPPSRSPPPPSAAGGLSPPAPASSKKVAFVGAGPPPASLVPVPSSKGRGRKSPRAATPSTSASFCAPSLLRKSPAAVNRDTPAPSGTQPPVGVEAGREEERQKRAPAAPASSMPPSRSPPPPSAAGGLSPPAPASSKKVAFVGAGPPPASLVPVPSSKGRGGESPRAATPSTSASFCAPSLLRKSPAAVNRDTPAPSGTQPPVGVEAGREEERQKRAPAAPASSMPPSRSPPPPSAAGGLSPPAPASSKKVAFVGAGPPPASLVPVPSSKGRGGESPRAATPSTSASFCAPSLLRKSPAAVNRDTPAPSGTQPPVGVEAGREEERQKRAPAAPASSMPPSRSPPPPSAAGGLSPPAPASSKKVAFVGAGPPPASLVPVPSSKGRGRKSPRAATPSTSASFCAPSLLRKSPAAVNRDTPAPSGTQPPVGVEAGREEERQKRAPAAPASSMPPSRSPPPPSAAGGLSPPTPASSKKVAFVGAGPPPASLEPAGFSKGLGKATKRTASESSSASFCPPRIMCKDISMKQEVVLLTFSGDAGNAGRGPAGKRENASVGETDANHEGFPKTGRDSSLSGLSQLKPATPQGASVKVGSQEGKKEAFLSPSSTKGALAGKGGSPSPGATQSAPEKLKSQVPAPSFKSGVGKASQSPGFEKRFQKAKLSSGTKADLGDEGLPSTTGEKANAGKAIPSSASAAAGVVPSREIQSQSAPAQKTAGGLLEKRSSSPPQRKASVCLADSKQLPAKTPVPAGSASPSTGGAVSSAKRVTTKVSPHLEAAASRPSLPATLPRAKASTPDHLQQPGCTPPAQEEATGTAGCYLGPTEKKPGSLPKKGVISAADAKKGVFVKATLPGKVGKTVAAGLPKSETSSGPSGSKVVTATSTPKSKQLLSAASPAKAGGKEGGVKKERPPGGSPQNGGEGEASQQGGEVREQAKSVPAMALKASLPQPSEKAPQAKSAPTKHAVNEPASSSGLGGGMSAFRDSKRIVSDNVDSKQNHTPVVSPPSLSAPTSLMQHAQVGTESHKAERESDLRPRRSGSHHRRKTHRRLEDFLALLEEEGGADITAKLIKRLEALYSRLGGPPPATFEVRSSQSSSPPSPIDGINPQSLGYVPLLDRVRALAAEAPRVPDFPGLGSVREERAAGSKGSIPAKEGGSEHAEPVVKQARVVEAVPEALEPTRIEAPSPPAQNAAAASGKPAGVDVVQEAEKRASQALAALAARRREEQTARARQTEENQAQVKAERATRTSFDYEPESQREWQRLTRGWSLEGLGVVESLCEPETTAAITASERPADVDLGVSLFVPVTYEGDNLRRTTVYDPLSDAERLKQEADEGVLGICVRQRRYIIGSHQPPPPVASPILNDSSGDERSQPRGNRRTRRRAARTRLSLMPLFSRQIAMRQHLEDLKAQRRRAMQASHEQHTRKQRRIRRKEPKTQNDDIFAAVRRDRRRLQSHRPFWARLGRNTDLQAGDARSDLSERSSFDSDDEEDEKSCFVARQMVQRNYEQLLNLGMTAGGNRGQE